MRKVYPPHPRCDRLRESSSNSMTSLESGAVEVFTLATGLLLLGFGVFLLVYLRRIGGLEFSLAQMISVPRNRTTFLAGLVICLASLFGIGLFQGIGILVGFDATVIIAVQTGLFGVGAGGMILLMINSLRAREPSLEAAWHVQETGERFSASAMARVTDLNAGKNAGVGSRFRNR